MKNRLFYTAITFFLLLSFSANSQTKISRVSDYDYAIENKENRQIQTKTVQQEINHLEMASTQIGKTALPNIYINLNLKN